MNNLGVSQLIAWSGNKTSGWLGYKSVQQDSLVTEEAVAVICMHLHVSLKMQEDPLQADWSSGKFGMRHNSVWGEQIMP